MSELKELTQEELVKSSLELESKVSHENFREVESEYTEIIFD